MSTLPRPLTTALSTIAALAAVLAWDFSGLDLWLAGLMGTPAGFPWRNHWLFTGVLHDGARLAVALALALLAIATVRPFGSLRTLAPGRRLWLLAAVAGAMMLVSGFKRLTLTDCPWDLAAFGGALPYVPHWQPGVTDGGPGHCFPAGHASAGFAWMAGWFAWPPGARSRRRWLVAGLVAGAVLGLSQQVRGAHFMSHTLWTAWICWAWAWAFSALQPWFGATTASPHAPAAD